MSQLRLPPSIAELTTRYLSDESVTVAHAASSEVELHETHLGFRVDAATAYRDACLAQKLLGGEIAPFSMPSEWANYVAQLDEIDAMPMAVGNVPQQVRELARLLTSNDLSELAPASAEPINVPAGLKSWAKKATKAEETKWLARAILSNDDEAMDRSPLAMNERAARLWTNGEASAALAIWMAMPDSPVASFNRGVGLLFTGQASRAQGHFQQAIAGLPENSGWNHLARLYLALSRSS